MGAEISHPQDRLWSALYPMEAPHRQRTYRKMQVLALGLSRSGTDSLRQALIMLGYHGVYHGFEITGGSREDTVFWIPWLKRKLANGGSDSMTFLPDLTADSFDTVLGDREAVTDTPANAFGEELMLAYPNAKIILNRRQDLNAWHRSMQRTVIPIFSPFMWWCCWFDRGLFWVWRNYYLSVIEWAKGDFNRYGKEAYVAHYAQMEEACQRNGREYLDWSVEDGWEPLCRFLCKPIPHEPFPHGNAAGQQFKENMERIVGNVVKIALARSIVAVTAVTVLCCAIALKLRRS